MAFTSLLARASAVISNLRGDSNDFVGKEGDIIYRSSTNSATPRRTGDDTDSPPNDLHQPGYLSVHCQSDAQLGATLILQWLPNTTLTANPRAIRSISPRRPSQTIRVGDNVFEEATPNGGHKEEEEENSSPEIRMEGDKITVTTRVILAHRMPQFSLDLVGEADGSTPNISVIPNTPVDPRQAPLSPGELPPVGHWSNTAIDHPISAQMVINQGGNSNNNNGNYNNNGNLLLTGGGESVSPATSYGCDSSERCDGVDLEETEEERLEQPLSPTWLLDDQSQKQRSGIFLAALAGGNASEFGKSAEQFASEHNLMLPDNIKSSGENHISVTVSAARFSRQPPPVTLFSVDLGKMRSLRLFYSDAPECTSGQLVIASHESQYKILHFHHGGLDKLAAIFEQWRALRAKNEKPASWAKRR